MPAPLVFHRPHSVEAERHTLGALLLDGDRLADVVSELIPADFHDPSYRAIYRAMLHLLEQRIPIDFVTLSDALKDNADIQARGGTAFLAQLANNVPTASNALAYARIIREKSLYRRLIEVGQTMTTLASSEEIPAE